MVSDLNKPYISADIFNKRIADVITLVNDQGLKAKIAQSNLKKYQHEYQLSAALEARKNIILSKVMQP